MEVKISDVEEVLTKTIKDGRIVGLTSWEGRTAKILILKNSNDECSFHSAA